MKITKEELLQQAQIIQIGLTENESDVILDQINNILDYVSNIENFDYKDNQELQFLLDDNNRFREDTSYPSISLEEALRNAPKKNENFFKVPKIIE